MRGKYKSKRLAKKYKPIIELGRNSPAEFTEEYLGVKLFWWQKIVLNNRSFGLKVERW